MSSNQNIWGPYMWRSIHIIALNYPYSPSDQHKIACRQFFESLQYMLPCSICQKNFRQKLIDYPIQLNSRKDLFEWSVKLHNIVNGCLGKRQILLNEVIELYEEYTNSPIYLTQEAEDAAKKNGSYRSTGTVATKDCSTGKLVEGFTVNVIEFATIAILVAIIFILIKRLRGHH